MSNNIHVTIHFVNQATLDVNVDEHAWRRLVMSDLQFVVIPTPQGSRTLVINRNNITYLAVAE